MAWALRAGGLVLRLHVALGLVLVVDGGSVLVAAARARERLWVWTAAVALGGMLGAAGNGASYLIYDREFSSFFMSCGLAIALTAYAAGIYRTR